MLPADITAAEFSLHPLKRPGIQHPGQGLHQRRPLRSLQAVIAEVPLRTTTPSHRRRRTAAAEVTGFVLCHRQGDVVTGVRRWWRVTAVFSTLTAGAVNEWAKNLRGFQILLVIRDVLILSDSNFGNTGTPVVTASRLVRALRSFILLYMYVIIEMNILMLRGFFGMVAFTGVFSLTATAVTLLKTAVIAVNIRVIVQPDKRSPAPGPVDFDPNFASY